MAASFEKLLAEVSGKVHVVNFSDDYQRYKSGLLYYWHKAEHLHEAAKMIWPSPPLGDVAIMLTGMSMELLLKGICVAFDKDIPGIHRLDKLYELVGIPQTEDDKIVLRAISENVIWYARYPTPRDADKMLEAFEVFKKQRRQSGNLSNYFIEERASSFDNCERLWGVVAEHYHRARDVRIESVELRRGED